MKFVRLQHDGIVRWGIEQDSRFVVLSGRPFDPTATSTGEPVARSDATVLAPVDRTATIVGTGVNYPPLRTAHHGRPRHVTRVPGGDRQRRRAGRSDRDPPVEGQVVHEGELAVVIGTTTSHVNVDSALEHGFGCTIADDVTARDQMVIGGQWARAKSFGTFCPLGPAIETELDPSNAGIVTTVDDEPRRRGNTRDLVFSVSELISDLSGAVTLDPGDVILTGSPPEPGAIEAGQHLAVTIPGIGTPSNDVRDRA